MEKKINYENLSFYAYSNDKLINGKIKGLVIDFFGLGCMAMYHNDTSNGKFYAENNVIYVVPYTNPWGWMNRDEVRLADEIIDVILENYNLDGAVLPIVSIGGSMGGLACIVYTKYAKYTPVGCVANCPVCDLPYHYTERVDLPRTLYSAFYSYEESMEDALKSCSPLHLAKELPKKTEYTIFHCEKDSAVNIGMHSDQFVKELSKYRSVNYYTVPDRDHCDLDEENEKKYLEAALEYINKNC